MDCVSEGTWDKSFYWSFGRTVFVISVSEFALSLILLSFAIFETMANLLVCFGKKTPTLFTGPKNLWTPIPKY